jgi:hypothetical protein
MADDQESARQAVIEASIGSAQRLAMRIIYLPKDRREAGLETVRRIFSEELRKYGYDDQFVQRGLNCRSKAFAASFQKLRRPAADVTGILKQKGSRPISPSCQCCHAKRSIRRRPPLWLRITSMFKS